MSNFLCPVCMTLHPTFSPRLFGSSDGEGTVEAESIVSCKSLSTQKEMDKMQSSSWGNRKGGVVIYVRGV